MMRTRRQILSMLSDEADEAYEAHAALPSIITSGVLIHDVLLVMLEVLLDIRDELCEGEVRNHV